MEAHDGGLGGYYEQSNCDPSYARVQAAHIPYDYFEVVIHGEEIDAWGAWAQLGLNRHANDHHGDWCRGGINVGIGTTILARTTLRIGAANIPS